MIIIEIPINSFKCHNVSSIRKFQDFSKHVIPSNHSHDEKEYDNKNAYKVSNFLSLIRQIGCEDKIRNMNFAIRDLKTNMVMVSPAYSLGAYLNERYEVVITEFTKGICSDLSDEAKQLFKTLIK